MGINPRSVSFGEVDKVSATSGNSSNSSKNSSPRRSMEGGLQIPVPSSGGSLSDDLSKRMDRTSSKICDHFEKQFSRLIARLEAMEQGGVDQVGVAPQEVGMDAVAPQEVEKDAAAPQEVVE